MKSVYSFVVLSLVAAMCAVGCGKSQNNAATPVSAVTGAAIPQPGVGATMATGCYYNGSSTCAPCPTGYTQNGTYCTATAGAQPYPNGYNNCAYGGQSAYSYQYGGCVVGTQQQYQQYYGSNSNYYCQQNQVGFVCYSTYGQPLAGYYFNGYGWVRYY
ncbi:MAG: hypothetical protein HY075_12645 [Deltaproteobacteria bacterium]|nr:hypothetical protein [Deltaproteobacteria bacterium]